MLMIEPAFSNIWGFGECSTWMLVNSNTGCALRKTFMSILMNTVSAFLEVA